MLEAALDEATKSGLRTTMHHAQNNVTRVNALTSARWGLTSMEHWYGLPEALFDDQTIQDYPVDYNYSDEQHRFGQAAQVAAQQRRNRHREAVLLARDGLFRQVTLSNIAQDALARRAPDGNATSTANR